MRVMIQSWTEINWYQVIRARGIIPPLPKRKPDMPGGRYIIDAVTAFDIETTRLDLPIPDGAMQNSHSFMYVWQFQFEDITVMGRTWDDFLMMTECIRSALEQIKTDDNLPTVPRLVSFIHNASYEWQFIQGIYHFQNEDVFLRENRKVIYFRMYDCIEFRCSYIQTNQSLAELTKNMGVEQKLSGEEYDYNKIRYPWTELSEYETEYCVRDVRSLVACMKKRMEKDGDNLQTLPLTSTGYPRRDCKKAISGKPLCYQVRDMKPQLEVYRMLRKAFRGGNTHANRKYVGQILQGVSSYDMASCYPAQQLTKKFPMKPYKFLNDNLDLNRVLKFVGLGYSVVATYVFMDLKIKDGVTIPYLSLAKTESSGFLGGIDNGRILYARTCETTLTELDLDIVIRQYHFDKVLVKSAMVAQKDYLPEEYRKVIMKYYERKTYLKGATDDDEVYQYNKNKALVNAVFGCSCQDPIHSEVLYDDGNYTNVNLYDDPVKAKEALQKAHFPYQWGVYVAALGRHALQDAIDAAGDRMVYCDTDSVKVIGDIDLSEINKKRRKVAERMGAVADDRKGKKHPVGVFEDEGKYDRFITLGAKRYAYEKQEKHGYLHITVSGVSKKVNPKTDTTYAAEELEKLENFQEGFIWRESAGTLSVYNDKDDFVYHAPGGDVHITPNVAILPNTYELGLSKDYKKLITDIILYGDFVDRRK